MTFDLKDNGTGAPPNGVAFSDKLPILRDGAASPYKTTLDFFPAFDRTHRGLVPVPGGNSGDAGRFLREDGTWGVPPTGSAGTTTVITSAAGYTAITPYAFGGIGDGNAHTIGTAPSGHILAGKTTLSQVAAVTVNGEQPFSFVTQAPFTASFWQLTDGKVSGLDLDWLAIQACMWRTGRVFLPKGVWIVGSQYALPLLIRESTGDDPSVWGHPSQLIGEGPTSTAIRAGKDFGAGVPLVSCGDPTATKANGLGRYSGYGFYTGMVSQLSLFGPPPVANAMGTLPCAMTGLNWGCRLALDNIQINLFAKGLNIVGDGHNTIMRAIVTQYCGYGAYWDDPSGNLYGDIDFDLASFSGCTIAAIGVHGNASVIGVRFKGKVYLNGPYAFFGEKGGTGEAILRSVQIDQAMIEWCGNGFIHDDNGFDNGTYGSGARRDCINVHIGSMYASFNNDKFWGDNGRGRVAFIDCRRLSGFVIANMDPDAAEYSPTQGPTGPAPIAFMRVTGADGEICGDIQALCDHLKVNGAQFAPQGSDMGSFRFERIGLYSGSFQNYSRFDGNGSKVGEALTRHYNGCCISGAIAGRPLIGVALMAGVPDGGVMPTVTRAVQVNVLQGPTAVGSQNRGVVVDTTRGTVTTAPDGTVGFGWYQTTGQNPLGENILAISIG